MQRRKCHLVMQHLILLLSLLLLCDAMPISAASESGPSNVSFEQILALPVSTPAAILDYGEHPLQFGKLWLPAPTGSVLPLVILIHGGCWLNSFHVDHTDTLGSALAETGFAVWAIEYRRIGDPGGGWPGTMKDVLMAVDFAIGLDSYQAADFNLDDYSIESSAPAIIGHSADGHLALLAGIRQPRASIIIGMAAIADLEKYARGTNECQQATAAFMGESQQDNPDSYQHANPARHSLHPASLLLGDKHTILPADQAEGLAADKIVVAGAGHFDWIHPGTPAFAELSRQLDVALRP